MGHIETFLEDDDLGPSEWQGEFKLDQSVCDVLDRDGGEVLEYLGT